MNKKLPLKKTNIIIKIMGFDFENIIYLLGLLFWIISAVMGYKKKNKPLDEKKIHPRKSNENKIPKSFSDLVEQVKTELDNKGMSESEIPNNKDKEILYDEESVKDIEQEKELENSSVYTSKKSSDNIKKQDDYELDNDLKEENKEVKRLAGYEIKKEINEKYENDLFSELNDKDSLKKAFLFKEILKRKFK